MAQSLQLSTASVLTLSWVRAFVVWMAADARAGRQARSASAEERRVQAEIAASLRGDGAAYARIIERYQAAIARRMTRFARDAGAIEELTHDVFVEAYFSLPSYRAAAPLEHWLQRIATRVGFRYWKRVNQHPTISFQEQVHDRPTDDGSSTVDDACEAVAAVLERLPPRDRLVLTLLYLESRSVAEAAEMAGWSQTMVKVQAYRREKSSAIWWTKAARWRCRGERTMNEIEMLRRSGARSDLVAHANVDVTARVLRTIRRGHQRRWPESVRPLVTVLAASWMTVLVTGLFVQEVWSELQDPLTSLVTPFLVALQ